LSGPAASAEIDGDDGIDRLAVDGVILAHADPTVTALIDHAVGEAPLPPAPRRLGRERPRLGHAWHLPIEAAVPRIGEKDRPGAHGPWFATVFACRGAGMWAR